MPNVTYGGTTYPCAKALKGADYIHLLDSNGTLISAFDGITDVSGLSIDTDWTIPTPNNDCYLAVIGDDGIIRKGSHKCCDIPSFEDADELGIDDRPTENSKNLVTSGGVKSYVDSTLHTGTANYLVTDGLFEDKVEHKVEHIKYDSSIWSIGRVAGTGASRLYSSIDDEGNVNHNGSLPSAGIYLLTGGYKKAYGDDGVGVFSGDNKTTMFIAWDGESKTTSSVGELRINYAPTEESSVTVWERYSVFFTVHADGKVYLWVRTAGKTGDLVEDVYMNERLLKSPVEWEFSAYKIAPYPQ